jgi:hypothetical protein
VHFVDAGVLADIENLLPGLSTICGLVETTVPTGTPQRPLAGDTDDVRVFGMDDDSASSSSAASSSAPLLAAITAGAVSRTQLIRTTNKYRRFTVKPSAMKSNEDD